MIFKKINRIILYTLFCNIIVLSNGLAQIGIAPSDVERVGQAGWQFLKVNGDPIASAMGGVITAGAHGNASAIFGNPASLVDVQGGDLAFNQVSWIADIGYQSLAVAKKFGKWGVFGLSVASIDYGDMAETINSEIVGENRTEAVVTGSYFTAGDVAAGLSYAKAVTDRLSIGGNVRWIRSKIAELSMNNVSLDFGTIYYTGFRSLRLAMVARNFGPDSHLTGWDEELQAEADDIRMPIDFRIGMAMDFFDGENSPHLLTVILEGDHPNDGPEKVHFGANYVFKELFSLRGGYRFNYDEQGLTLGAGLYYKMGPLAARLDYAFIDFGVLNKVHMFAVGIAF